MDKPVVNVRFAEAVASGNTEPSGSEAFLQKLQQLLTKYSAQIQVKEHRTLIGDHPTYLMRLYIPGDGNFLLKEVVIGEYITGSYRDTYSAGRIRSK